MYVGTVHSSCQRLLADRKLLPPGKRQKPPRLLDDLDQYLFVARRGTWTLLCEKAGLDAASAATEITAFLGSRPSQSKHEAVTACIALFNRLSEECIDPNPLKDRTSDSTFKKLLTMYAAYLELLKVGGSVPQTDFALLQQNAVALLEENPDAARRFKHIIVDEYQDTNSIQERLFFGLAKGSGNLCVVGDDDQALYRFRGATVENFVRFPERCKTILGTAPTEIPLVRNYRSRPGIVEAATRWLNAYAWKRESSEGYYRVVEKSIQPERSATTASVTKPGRAKSEVCCAEVARFVAGLVRDKRVTDANQVGFLYPSLKSAHVTRMIDALENEGLRTYAPRAQPFLATAEATDMLGLFALVLGIPDMGFTKGADWLSFNSWLRAARRRAIQLTTEHRGLAAFVTERQAEVASARSDFDRLSRVAEDRKWAKSDAFDAKRMLRVFAEQPGLSGATVRNLLSRRLAFALERRWAANRPHTVLYVIQRATAIDWSLLDLFYRLTAFPPFPEMFASAERSDDPDEGPIANLGLLTQYLSRFMDRRAAIVSGELLQDDRFQRLFFFGYLYALYKRGESEYEDAEDPFPKGRVPFLTVHQSKGLEFPVVVVGNLRKDDKGATKIERLVRPLIDSRNSEPLDRLGEYDIARLYYVAMTRAEDLLILPEYKGAGCQINEEFRSIVDSAAPLSAAANTVTITHGKISGAPGTYSYTGDYLAFRRCPRQYAIFRTFGFVPSRSQTMLFGTLVHRTLEDLHDHLIRQRATA